MWDNVEIGIGRTARKVFDLADINIVPSRRIRKVSDVSVDWKIDAYEFNFPILTHPTDAVVSPEFAAQFGKLGGLAVLNAEGLWGRYADPMAKILELQAVARADELGTKASVLLRKFYAAPLQNDFLTQVINTMKAVDITVAVRVSVQNAKNLVPLLVSLGVDLLVIQNNLISAEYVAAESDSVLNLKTFISDIDIPVIVGSVSDKLTALHLMRTGAAGVIVGHGAITGVDTSAAVLGIGTGFATAIADVAAARREYLDETGGRYVHIIANGGFNNSGDLVRALACGADAVMVGKLFTRAKNAAAQGWYWPTVAAHPKVPRGNIKKINTFETQTSLETLLFGPAEDASGTTNIVGAMRRALAKTGYTDVKEFQKIALTVK